MKMKWKKKYPIMFQVYICEAFLLTISPNFMAELWIFAIEVLDN